MLPASGQSHVKFSDTDGARAFAAGEFDRALAEFRRLNEANPGNTLILRYLAITLDRLARYDEAIAVYREALAVVPNDVALHYHLGVTQYNARRADDAEKSFRRVQQLAAGSEYANYAARYLDAIARQRVQQQMAGAPKRFSFFAQGGVQYDDNVYAATDGGDLQGASRATGYLSFEYNLHRTSEWLATLGLSGYGVWYNESGYDALETSTSGASAQLQRTGTLGKYPFVGSLRYDFSEVRRAEGGRYSRSNSLTTGLRLNLSKNTASHAYYRYRADDFADEGFDPVYSSRDADNHAVGLQQVWYFADRRGQVNGGIEYQHNDADGLNFVMDGTTYSLGLIVPLPRNWRCDLGVSYGEEDYTKFVGPVRRESDTWSYSAALSRWFGRHLLLRLDYNLVDSDSTYDQLGYRRETVGTSISYVH